MMTLITGPSDDRLGGPRYPMADLRKRSGGFTLIELILVMVLMCSILALVAPSLRNFFVSRQTANAAAQIVSLIQLARTQAVTEGRPYQLNWDTGAGTYWLTAQDPNGSGFVALNTEFGRTFTLPGGATFDLTADPNVSLAGNYIEFRPDGTTTAAAIGVTGREGDRLWITTPTLTDSFRVVATPQAQIQENPGSP